MSNRPEVIQRLRRDYDDEEAAQVVIHADWSISELLKELAAKDARIAELEASLRAALKSHDKIPVNIPLPSWVESARSTLKGKQDA